MKVKSSEEKKFWKWKYFEYEKKICGGKNYEAKKNLEGRKIKKVKKIQRWKF